MYHKGNIRLLALIVGIPLSVAVFFYLRETEKKSAEIQFNLTAENRTQSIQREISSNLAALHAFRAFLESSPPSEKEFLEYAKEVGAAYPSIQAFEWVPHVPGSQRQAMEELMSQRSGKKIVFHEGPPARVITSPKRTEHYPVEFYWGRNPEPDIDLIGIDIAGSPVLMEVMNNALVSGAPAVSRRWPLRERSLGRYGIMAFLPVFQKETQTTQSSSSAKLAGFALIIFRIQDLLEQSLASLDRKNLDIYFFDQSTAPWNRDLFFSSAKNIDTTQLTEKEALQPKRFRSSVTIPVANREWMIVYDGSQHFFSSVSTWQPYLFLFSGLFFTVLITAYINTLHKHSISSEMMVDQLTILNQELHKTIADQRKVEKELAVARDQALSAVQSKSRFLANMSHEIRTPMNGILGLTDLVLKADLQPEQRAHMEIVQSCGEDLLRILDGVLDLSKSETGKLELEHLPLDLQAIVLHVTELYAKQAQAKKIRVEMKWDQNIPVALIGDQLRIRQVLTNLISNAIKFTEKGSVTIISNLVSRCENQALIRITIQDTGIGISQEGMARLFHPFSQADDSTTRKYGGTGLGLTISKQLLELMNGSISVKSHLHQGTSFSITIPLAIASLEGTPHPVQNSQEELVSFSGRALLVEDNAVNQLVQKKLLEMVGFQVDVASNGHDALRLIKNIRYVSIFMDCQMPEMDGYETTQLIRKMEETQNYRTPIIAMTAHAFPEEKIHCTEAGMDAFLTKPVRKEELIVVVRGFLPVEEKFNPHK